MALRISGKMQINKINSTETVRGDLWVGQSLCSRSRLQSKGCRAACLPPA